MPDLFVSFRFKETLSLALALKETLDKQGLKTFVCAVPVGEDISKQIAKALAECKLAIILGSETYGQETESFFSTYNELAFILAEKKPFYLVKTCPV